MESFYRGFIPEEFREFSSEFHGELMVSRGFSFLQSFHGELMGSLRVFMESF